MRYLSTIEEYFSDNLKGQDLANFNLELKTNTVLRDEFEIYKRALKFIQSQENKLGTDLSKLDDFEFDPDILLDIQKYNSPEVIDEKEKSIASILQGESENLIRKRILRSIIIRWSKVAAMVTILLGIAMVGFYIVPKFTVSDQEIFIKFYKPYSHSLIQRSIIDDIDINLKEGLMFYDKGDYKSAMLAFSSLPDSALSNPEYIIIVGVSYMEIGRYNDAIQRLQKINEDNLLYTISLWYQGLCYLKLTDNQRAKEIFRKLKTYSPYYQKETRRLLRYI